MAPEIWYRYEERIYARPHDERDNSVGENRIEIRLLQFVVLKHTPKGAWVTDFWGSGAFIPAYKRFVRRDAKKRYACPTIEEAMESFLARKTRQYKILHAQLVLVERVIAKAKGVDILCG